MKKTLLLIAILTFSLIGCAAPVDEAAADREKELKEQIAQLEQEVKSLENQAKEDTANTSEATQEKADNSNVSVESLTSEVDEAIKKAESAKPSGTQKENQTTFFDLKSELDALDHKIDKYDDYLESQYRQNLLSYEEYRSQERKLENLEDRLDDAEDYLERTFKIDD